jgi:4'-phosphopantetheinyl transferase
MNQDKDKDTDTQVDVWRIAVAAFEPRTDALTALLSADERARAERFHFRRDQVRSVVARAGLRVLLGRMTGLAPESLDFVYGANGKPALAQSFPPVHFNLSHSGDVVLVALSRDCPLLGVDVEAQRDMTDLRAMAAYVLTARERAAYEALAPAAQPAAFYRAWTCKEALAKATGDGLAIGLAHYEIALADPDAARLLAVGGDEAEAAHWHLSALDVRPGYAGALAVRAPEVAVRVADLAPPP